MAVCSILTSFAMPITNPHPTYQLPSPIGASQPLAIGPPTFKNFFPSSPRPPNTPTSPRVRFVATGIKSLPPLSRFSTPTSISALSEAPTQNGAGSSTSSAHQHGIVQRSSGSGELKRKEGGWTLDKVKQSARGRLRPVKCAWRDESTTNCASGSKGVECDAVLASYTLLRKHLKRHYECAKTASETRETPGEVFPNYHCGWDGCGYISPLKLTELELHVQKEHLREVQETYCPFKDCPTPHLDREQYNDVFHYIGPAHALAYSASSLRSHPDPKQNLPHTPPPLPPPLPGFTTTTSFLVHAEPYRGPRDYTPSLASKPRRTAYNPTKEAMPQLEEIRHLILPTHREDYFVPMNGETPSTSWDLAVSSSIFPTSIIHGPDGDEYALSPEIVIGRRKVQLYDLMRGRNTATNAVATRRPVDQPVTPAPPTNPLDTLVLPGKSSGTLTQIVPTQRPKRCYAELALDARTCIHLSRLQTEKMKAERSDRKRKRLHKALAELQTTPIHDDETIMVKTERGFVRVTQREKEGERKRETRVDGDLVLRASVNRASKKVRRTIGYEHWLERLDFETRGIELGEIEGLVSK